MRQDTLRELTKLMFDLRSKACVALDAGETVFNVEQALESELIQFVQLSGENESLQFVIDWILKDVHSA
jgi:hypothetical protein